MERIIETLYINLNRPQAPDDPELEEIKREYSQLCDLFQAQYGTDLVDRFTALRDRIDRRDREREFSFGFRACARLLLGSRGRRLSCLAVGLYAAGCQQSQRTCQYKYSHDGSLSSLCHITSSLHKSGLT